MNIISLMRLGSLSEIKFTSSNLNILSLQCFPPLMDKRKKNHKSLLQIQCTQTILEADKRSTDVPIF